MLRIVFGVLLGVLLSAGFYFYAPVDMKSTIRAAGAVAEQKVRTTAFDICERKFLNETHCYQNPKKTSKECAAEVSAHCG